VPSIIEGEGLFDKPATVTVDKIVETIAIRAPEHPRQNQDAFIKAGGEL